MSSNSKSSIDYMSTAHRFIAVIVIIAVVFAGIHEIMQTHIIERLERKYFYPYPYENIVDKYAKQYNMDASLAAGIIFTESGFTPNAKSHRGAIGLMQIMPETGEWIAHNINDKNYSTAKLYDPETNIHYGMWYLSFLMKEFNNNEILVAAAYNAGHGQIEEWRRIYKWDSSFNDYDKIPFKETRDYVHKVLDNKESYQKLYNGG